MSGDGMSGMVSALTNTSTGITSANLWTEATAAAPLITTLFMFAFGVYVVRRVLGKGQHGKAGI